MKKTTIFCDVCETAITTKELERNIVTMPKGCKMQVIFTTEQDEGRKVDPYFEVIDLDICTTCKKEALSGKYLFAIGAMGSNSYSFNK